MGETKGILLQPDQAVIVGGFTIRPSRPVKLYFDAHDGTEPWFEWSRDVKVAMATKRRRATKIDSQPE